MLTLCEVGEKKTNVSCSYLNTMLKDALPQNFHCLN